MTAFGLGIVSSVIVLFVGARLLGFVTEMVRRRASISKHARVESPDRRETADVALPGVREGAGRQTGTPIVTNEDLLDAHRMARNALALLWEVGLLDARVDDTAHLAQSRAAAHAALLHLNSLNSQLMAQAFRLPENTLGN